jgi:hypothetical protein
LHRTFDKSTAARRSALFVAFSASFRQSCRANATIILAADEKTGAQKQKRRHEAGIL